MVEKRDIFGKKTKLLIKDGKIPGIVYSRHMKENVSVTVNRIDFLRTYKQAWESTVINLEWAIKTMALIYDMNIHPVTNQVLHIDFLAVTADEAVEADVPLVFVWESQVEKDKLWKVEKLKDTILVEALPNDLPHNIEVDLSVIKDVNWVFFVKDLVLSSKVKIKDDLELPILTVAIIEEEASEPVAQPSAPVTPTPEEKK